MRARPARMLLAASAALLLGAALGARFDLDPLLRGYLLGVLFCVGIAFGSLGILLIHAVTGGRWGALAHRPLLAASTTLPLLGVLFVPVLLGVRRLYPWARPGATADALIQHKSAYLNVPFFAARAIVFFALWSAIALILRRRAIARAARKGGDLTEPGAAMERAASPGLLLAGFTMTFAAIDWVMSLDPRWFSSIFGLVVLGGQLLSAQCFAIVAVALPAIRRGDPLPMPAFHDLGNLLLMFVMLWAYFAFSQHLIIYAGNLAGDAGWVLVRQQGGWQHVALSLIVLHFAAPFFVLLSRRSKRSARVLGGTALVVLAMQLVELYWLVGPSFYGPRLTLPWTSALVCAGVFGAWLSAFLGLLGRSQPAPAASP